MVFSSTIFLFAFLPALLALHFLAPRAARNAALLAGSLLFYAWGEVELIGVMLASIAGNYAFGLALDRARGGPRARLVLGLGVAFDLALLSTFKYAGFLTENANGLLALAGLPPLPVPDLVLPLGISFYTFQALSYLVDVYRGTVAAQRNLLRFALYVALFPQLIAGPIVRYTDVARDLARRTIGREGFAAGVRRFVVGLGKKVLVANTIATLADGAFGVPADELGPRLAWLGAVAYTIQLYFDFSGYSDMAIGLGRMLGFRFPENFDYPYTARSVTELWRRWHMSLTSWFRDYLYVPLGGNRRGPARTYFNLFVVFVLCGLWHGPAWTFVLFGLYHGALLVTERARLGRALEAWPSVARRAYVLLSWIVGLVLFRADDLPEALAYLRAMAGLGAPDLLHDPRLYLDAAVSMALVAGVVGSTPLVPRLAAALRRLDERPGLAPAATATALHGLTLVALLGVLLLAGLRLAAGTNNPFLYFRF